MKIQKLSYLGREDNSLILLSIEPKFKESRNFSISVLFVRVLEMISSEKTLAPYPVIFTETFMRYVAPTAKPIRVILSVWEYVVFSVPDVIGFPVSGSTLSYLTQYTTTNIRKIKA